MTIPRCRNAALQSQPALHTTQGGIRACRGLPRGAASNVRADRPPWRMSLGGWRRSTGGRRAAATGGMSREQRLFCERAVCEADDRAGLLASGSHYWLRLPMLLASRSALAPRPVKEHSGSYAAFVPGNSGGTATDLHRFPYSSPAATSRERHPASWAECSEAARIVNRLAKQDRSRKRGKGEEGKRGCSDEYTERGNAAKRRSIRRGTPACGSGDGGNGQLTTDQ
jgi:hypothetical protein